MKQIIECPPYHEDPNGHKTWKRSILVLGKRPIFDILADRVLETLSLLDDNDHVAKERTISPSERREHLKIAIDELKEDKERKYSEYIHNNGGRYTLGVGGTSSFVLTISTALIGGMLAKKGYEQRFLPCIGTLGIVRKELLEEIRKEINELLKQRHC